MTDALFEMAEPDPGRKHQACDWCLIGAWASDDRLRVRGWHVYDGTSFTGRPMHVRICPACQRKEARS
jgi:hypothetical protein